MKIELKQLTLKNFMMYHEKTVEFGEITKISGMNARGKSSILTGYTWLLFNCDYWLRDNPKVRREIDGVPVDDMDVSVEGIFDFDGKEVIARKIQRRKFSKDGKSFSDDNTYFINDESMTLKSYNDCFGLDMSIFRICSNVNAFLSKKSKEMRDFLLPLANGISDYDIACKYSELEPLVELLQNYKLDGIITMKKTGKTKCEKELSLLEGRIKEREEECTVDINVSALEMKRDGLKKQILKSEGELENSEKAYRDYEEKSGKVMELKVAMNEIVHKENEKLSNERTELQRLIHQKNNDFMTSRQIINDYEKGISQTDSSLKRNESGRFEMQEKYKAVISEEFNEADSVCPTCGQTLPEDKIEQLKSEFDDKKKERLQEIIFTGNSYKQAKEKDLKDLEEFEKSLKRAKEDSLRCNGEKGKAMEKLAEFPEEADLSGNQEYQSLKQKLESAGEAVAKMDSGANYRSQIKIQLNGLREELAIVAEEITRADTTEAKERLEELRNERLELNQSKADCEKILFLTDELDRHKNELLTDGINEKFSHVVWKLFEHAKSGGYKSTCIPMMDNQSIFDSANKGNKILGKLDICNSIQKITGINCPVFLDDAESLDSENIAKMFTMMGCQIVALKVTDDAELKIS